MNTTQNKLADALRNVSGAPAGNPCTCLDAGSNECPHCEARAVLVEHDAAEHDAAKPVTPADAWRAFLESLPRKNAAFALLPVNDADAAQLVADALDIVSPDGDEEQRAAERLCRAFSNLAKAMRGGA